MEANCIASIWLAGLQLISKTAMNPTILGSIFSKIVGLETAHVKSKPN